MEDTLSEKELGKPIVMSDDEPDIAKACERLSDHSDDDSNESVETVVKDSADHIEVCCEEVLRFGKKKELIKQSLSSLPPSTRLKYLQFFNEVAIVVLPSIKIVIIMLLYLKKAALSFNDFKTLYDL